jgi:glutathione S-transferase
MTTETLTLTRLVKAPRERVFEAFTKAEVLMQWFGHKGLTVPVAALDVRVGGRYRLEMHGEEGIYILGGEYREVLPPEKLVFTWVWEQGPIPGVETLVTITFAVKGKDTELTLVHSGIPTPEMITAHSSGWTSTLDCLDEMLDGRPKVPKMRSTSG